MSDHVTYSLTQEKNLRSNLSVYLFLDLHNLKLSGISPVFYSCSCCVVQVLALSSTWLGFITFKASSTYLIAIWTIILIMLIPYLKMILLPIDYQHLLTWSTRLSMFFSLSVSPALFLVTSCLWIYPPGTKNILEILIWDTFLPSVFLLMLGVTSGKLSQVRSTSSLSLLLPGHPLL